MKRIPAKRTTSKVKPTLSKIWNFIENFVLEFEILLCRWSFDTNAELFASTKGVDSSFKPDDFSVLVLVLVVAGRVPRIGVTKTSNISQ
jgi:hypothetical protein